MKISHFCLLSAILLMPQLTPAQAEGAPQAGSADAAARNSVHGSIDWAKERLDDMDATLALLERKFRDSNSENRAAAERAIAEMREQREALKQVIEAKGHAIEAEWQQKATVESRWTAFEAAVQKWADATRQDFADQNEIFVARAEAQLKAWKGIIDQLEASAKATASDRKREIDSASQFAPNG